MINLTIALIIAYILLFIIVARSSKLLTFTAEIRRKIIHIIGGSSALLLPIVFENKALPIFILFGVLFIFLCLIKYNRKSHNYFKSSIYDVARSDLAEFYFIISIFAIYLLTINQDYVYYFVPIALLTFTDSLAALFGIKFGKIKLLNKTLEGSIFGAIVSFIIVTIGLAAFSSLNLINTIPIAIVMAVMSLNIELICAKGLDNLFLPVVIYFLLQLLLLSPNNSIIFLTALITIAIVFFISWKTYLTTTKQSIFAFVIFYNLFILTSWTWI